MTPRLGALRRCFEGAIPSAIATCAADGTPNVAYLSQVHYVDESHVALTYQFFNSTRKNILANPRATVQVVDPDDGAHYRLQLEYLRTETEGALFENMKAKLAGIASHTGMSKVFRLMGSDVYRVLVIEPVQGGMPSTATARPNLLPGLRACLAGLAGCSDLAQLFDETLQGLERYCDIRQAMLLMHDAARGRLYTVATRGYAESGVGSEICMGEGIVGVAARERTPIRIGYAAQEYLYSRAMRKGFERSTDGDALETEIPFPGLPDSASQLAVPLTFGPRLLGVMYVESPQELRFTFEDEDVLIVLAGQLALAMELLSHSAEQHEEVAAAAPRPPAAQGAPVTVRHFAADHSVFIDNDYLIKGVAGAIFWKLLRDHVEAGRSDFTNRELRLDPALKLPDISDNLEARLILLQRRLAERCPFLVIEKTGRGRFRLNVSRPLKLSAA
ncbi:histidine kinase [Sulfuricaulis limicola]|uniref:Histidine kinase n=1 Tax=Sulfuricaulis limicola TaxID=1620215 RepID=A0A1B4XJD8_9GAMM|nr:GAF domain-containing protein [Sulfuricaulis limicola]BAV34912.1 histidine kinase [Sulfuricaulis limicola]